MSKFFTKLFVMLALTVTASFAQWKYVGSFPDANFKVNSGGHGLAVDPEGKVWFQAFGATDSIVTAAGQKLPTRVVYVFNPDGTPASFSPIKTITVNGVTDSMQTPPGWSNRGLRADHQGNILHSNFDRVFRLNYKTGEGMNKVTPKVNTSLTAVGVDRQGNIFTGAVVPGNPVKFYDKDFNELGVAIDSSKGFSRTFEVSRDGNTIYWAGYTNHAVYAYTRPDEFSSYTLTDTLLKGFDSESCAWEPNSNNLWFSAGSYNDRPNRFPGTSTSWSPGGWYAYNVKTGVVADSLVWQFNTPGNVNERPRGIAFSPDGNTAYVTCFGASDYPVIQKFERVPVASSFTTPTSFPSDNFKVNSGGHGLAVDPDGKIWFQAFGATDSIVTAGGQKLATRVVYVFNPDGTPAAFSPIKTITVNGVTDSMQTPPGWSNRGLRADHEGNILHSNFDRVFRLNYKTGAGMNKVTPKVNTSLTATAVDANGNIFTGAVVPGNPVKFYDKDFNELGVAIDSSKGFSRAFEVSKDGNTIYWAGYTNHAIYAYTRPDEFSSYALTDTLLKGFDSESCGWEPNSNRLWFSAGSYNDLPNRFPGAITNYTPGTWYAFDVTTQKIVDKIDWQFNVPNNVNERPRGIAFSPDGKTAYTTCFGANTYPAIQKFVKVGTSVDGKESNWAYVETFQLFQNYPNPFNPQTTIPFELQKTGPVQVRVYDMTGREVATLVDKVMPAGSHNLTFDAHGLASGTYYYRLMFNGQTLTKRMLYVK